VALKQVFLPVLRFCRQYHSVSFSKLAFIYTLLLPEG
jgi:hypothetical protein